jgi:hypothetical protein
MKIWTNGTEWWIAQDLEHLRKLYREFCGLELEDEDVAGDGWEPWPDDKPIRIRENEDDDSWPPDGVTLLPAEWIARDGPGFLCSTEY